RTPVGAPRRRRTERTGIRGLSDGTGRRGVLRLLHAAPVAAEPYRSPSAESLSDVQPRERRRLPRAVFRGQARELPARLRARPHGDLRVPRVIRTGSSWRPALSRIGSVFSRRAGGTYPPEGGRH